MIMLGPHSLFIFCLGGCFGFGLLLVLLIYLSGPPNLGVFVFDAFSRRCDGDFISILANILDLQISMYVLRGMLNSGAIFALFFSCLAVILFQIESARKIVCQVASATCYVAMLRSLRRFWTVPGQFCALAVLNAYLCQPVGPFIFLRWLVIDAPLADYFLSGLLVIFLRQLLTTMVKSSRQTVFLYGLRATTVFVLFLLLNCFWPDMNGPLVKFLIANVHDTSQRNIFGSPGYHSYFPQSPYLWDLGYMYFALIAMFACQLSATKLTLRSLKFQGKFRATRLCTAKFVLSLAAFVLTLILNVQMWQMTVYTCILCQHWAFKA